MKIDDIWKPKSIEADSEIQKKGPNRANDEFAAMLHDEMSGAEQTDAGQEIFGIAPAFHIPAIAALPSDPEGAARISSVEGLISKLQSLAVGIGGNMSPKEVDGIINELGTASAKLQGEFNGLAGEQPLKELAEEINVTAYMESVKWRRGDYL